MTDSAARARDHRSTFEYAVASLRRSDRTDNRHCKTAGKQWQVMILSNRKTLLPLSSGGVCLVFLGIQNSYSTFDEVNLVLYDTVVPSV